MSTRMKSLYLTCSVTCK